VALCSLVACIISFVLEMRRPNDVRSFALSQVIGSYHLMKDHAVRTRQAAARWKPRADEAQFERRSLATSEPVINRYRC
jgi:hypothetical protein